MGIEIKMANSTWGVGDIEMFDVENNPIPAKLLAVKDPESGIEIHMAFSQDKADELALALKSGVVPVGAMTPEQMARVARG
jgi:hypothetical protein